MSSRNNIFCVTISLIISFLTLSPAVSIYAQSISSEVAQWFVPLDLGKQLKIKCNGSLVDFVSDCTSPANCKSLRQAGNDILECIPDSKFKNTDEQSIFRLTNTRERLTIKSKTCSLNEIIVLR